MLKYPDRDYVCKDTVLVECDSQTSSRCKRFYKTKYAWYKENLERNDDLFICRTCGLKNKFGVETLIELRSAESILEGNKKHIGMKYKMVKKRDSSGRIGMKYKMTGKHKKKPTPEIKSTLEASPDETT